MTTVTHGYAQGDLSTTASSNKLPARDALRITQRTVGQHQGRCLMDAEPVPLHESHPAYHRTEGRVDLPHLNSLTVTTGKEMGLDPPVCER